MFAVMTPMLETAQSVASRLGLPETEVSAQLEDMTERGLLFRLKKETGPRYGAIPFVHGLYEFQVKELKPDFCKNGQGVFRGGIRLGHAGRRWLFSQNHPSSAID